MQVLPKEILIYYNLKYEISVMDSKTNRILLSLPGLVINKEFELYITECLNNPDSLKNSYAFKKWIKECKKNY